MSKLPAEQTKTVKALKAALEAIVATLDICEDRLHCDAPLGYYWCAPVSTAITIQYANHSQTWLVKAIREDAERLNEGLRLCTPEETEAEDYGQARGAHSFDGEPEPSWKAPEGSPEKIDFNFSI